MQQQEQQEIELFHDYELRGWQLSPRIYKILGIAAAMHLFGFIVLSQVDLLGTKACDSPYVGKVCQVLDAAYVSSVLLGTDMEFSSRDYDKTEIEDADVTFIDVSDQFAYPAGYFEQANPATPDMMDPMLMSQNMTTMSDGSIPGFPGMSMTTPSTTTLDPNTPAVLPTPNPTNPIEGTLPGINPPNKSGGGFGYNPTLNRTFRPRVAKNFPRQAKVKNQPSTTDDLVPNPQQNANKDPNVAKNTDKNQDATKNTNDGTKSEDDGLFNKKPLEVFGAKYGEAILNNQVNLNAPFAVQVTTKLDEKGKFIKPVMTTKPGSDEKMTEVAKEAIAAFGDSQLLKTLYDVGGRNITIKFEQNENQLQAIILTETESDNRAKVLSSLLNAVLKNTKLKEGSDEEKLFKKAEFSTQGKVFIINFLIPNEEKTEMIQKNLRSLQDKLKQQQQTQQQTQQKQSDNGLAENAGKSANSAK